MEKHDLYYLAAKALIKNPDGSYLVLEVDVNQFITPEPEHWDIPGGRIARGEDIETALKREIAEETGIADVNSVKLLGNVIANMRIPSKDKSTDHGLIISLYEVAVGGEIIINLSPEHLSYQWVTQEDLPAKLAHKYPEGLASLYS